MTDRGAKALAERLSPFFEPDGVGVLPDGTEDSAAAILDEHGLFIPDVTKHEPAVRWNDRAHIQIVCRCGWESYPEIAESYFDHLAP